MSTNHVVVIGAGMVGHRFVDDLLRKDPEGTHQITLIGEEEYEPYNRIMLSEVVAGRADMKALTLPMPDSERVSFRRGVAALSIDREQQTVTLSDGDVLDYDQVVLATGARAFVPPISGLDSDPKHIHVLRTIDDCREVAARAVNAKHAIVLGGGVLGIEAACGMRRRGVPVTVIDMDPTLMSAQLDPAPGDVLVRRLGDLGIDARPGVSVAEVISAYDEMVAVRLTDGSVLATDMMLVSCGVRANSELAAAAGLEVDRGIVVDNRMATSDPRIFAVGDCAQSPQGMTGLLAPGWRQAEQLATDIADPVVSTDHSLRSLLDHQHTPEGVKLKAAGVDLITLGVRPSDAAPDDRVLSLSDPGGRRHIDLVVRQTHDGDRLVGVTCLGASDVAASVSIVFERGTPMPMDPLALLLPEKRTEEVSPVRMPGATTVCRCNAVTKKEIVKAWEGGCSTVEQIAGTTRATTGCGGCTSVVCGIVDWLNASDPGVPDSTSQPADSRAVSSVART